MCGSNSRDGLGNQIATPKTTQLDHSCLFTVPVGLHSLTPAGRVLVKFQRLQPATATAGRLGREDHSPYWSLSLVSDCDDVLFAPSPPPPPRRAPSVSRAPCLARASSSSTPAAAVFPLGDPSADRCTAHGDGRARQRAERGSHNHTIEMTRGEAAGGRGRSATARAHALGATLAALIAAGLVAGSVVRSKPHRISHYYWSAQLAENSFMDAPAAPLNEHACNGDGRLASETATGQPEHFCNDTRPTR